MSSSNETIGNENTPTKVQKLTQTADVKHTNTRIKKVHWKKKYMEELVRKKLVDQTTTTTAWPEGCGRFDQQRKKEKKNVQKERIKGKIHNQRKRNKKTNKYGE